ncbi:MAG: hypothetical protein IJ205_06750 [Bacteroidales bacterium]|nr:hypothetical protein [Bacteroidales bacterium]
MGNYSPVVRNWEGMLKLIKEYKLIPFFANPIPGYSVEEHTPADLWFTEENLGPWDWKIDCVQSGDVAYGKFLLGGKSAFATVDVYREILNWRRSLSKYQPNAAQLKVLEYMHEQGSISVAEVRKLMNMKKSAADAMMSKLQLSTHVIIGDISRVFRGPELKYSGWQRCSFCSPEALFEELDFPFPGYTPRTLKSSLTPGESLEFLKEIIRNVCGDVPDKILMRMLG